jgi:hypothetical protein
VGGLWGLFSIPARDSGLREKVAARLTGAARVHLLPHLEAALSAEGVKDDVVLTDLLLRDQGFEPAGRHRALGRALARLTAPGLSQEEQSFFPRYLVHGNRGPE